MWGLRDGDMGDIVQRQPPAWLQLLDRDQETGLLDVIAERCSELPKQLASAHGPEHGERLRARLELPVFQAKDERGDIADVIGVKVRDAEVRDVLPGQLEAGEVADDAGSAVEQHAARADAHEIAG